MNSSNGSRRAFVCGIFALTLALTLVLAACSGSSQKGSAAQSAPSVPASAAPSVSSSAPASGAPGSVPSTSAAPTAGAPASAAVPAAVASAPGACGDARNCYEAPNFTATVTNFRTSTVSAYRVIDATIRFQNKTAKPLTLGYANASGVAVDEKGNRYIVGGANGFRGIGLVNGQTADPRFVIAPASFGDARFELSWFPGNAIVGSTFELDLTVNEIETLEGNQHRVGGEFPLTFRGLLNELPK